MTAIFWFRNRIHLDEKLTDWKLFLVVRYSLSTLCLMALFFTLPKMFRNNGYTIQKRKIRQCVRFSSSSFVRIVLCCGLSTSWLLLTSLGKKTAVIFWCGCTYNHFLNNDIFSHSLLSASWSSYNLFIYTSEKFFFSHLDIVLVPSLSSLTTKWTRSWQSQSVSQWLKFYDHFKWKIFKWHLHLDSVTYVDVIFTWAFSFLSGIYWPITKWHTLHTHTHHHVCIINLYFSRQIARTFFS